MQKEISYTLKLMENYDLLTTKKKAPERKYLVVSPSPTKEKND